MKKNIVFIDLDGTLVNTISGRTFPVGIWDMQLNFQMLEALKSYAPKHIHIVTNQGGIEKGYVKEHSFFAKLNYVEKCVADYCDCICTSDYCASNDVSNICRKPNIGMLQYFSQDCIAGTDCNRKECIMIGDMDTDRQTAENFGCMYYDVNDFITSYNPKGGKQ